MVDVFYLNIFGDMRETSVNNSLNVAVLMIFEYV